LVKILKLAERLSKLNWKRLCW